MVSFMDYILDCALTIIANPPSTHPSTHVCKVPFQHPLRYQPALTIAMALKQYLFYSVHHFCPTQGMSSVMTECFTSCRSRCLNARPSNRSARHPNTRHNYWILESARFVYSASCRGRPVQLSSSASRRIGSNVGVDDERENGLSRRADARHLQQITFNIVVRSTFIRQDSTYNTERVVHSLLSCLPPEIPRSCERFHPCETSAAKVQV